MPVVVLFSWGLMETIFFAKLGIDLQGVILSINLKM